MHFYQESRQIESITCEYCNQVHSVKDNFKTLYRYQKSMYNIQRIPLGTVGKIKDVEFTVIGYVVYTDAKVESLNELDSDEWWIEYQLYSKTHGYAFLSYEEESYYFYHRVYDLSQPLMDNVQEFDSVRFRDKFFKVEEPYYAYAYFVAGTLTWKAKVGDSTYCVDAESGSGWFSDADYTLSYERSKTEDEYYLGEPIEYLDEAFRDGATTVTQRKESKVQKKVARPKKKKKRKKRRQIKSVRRRNRVQTRHVSSVQNSKTKHSLLLFSLITFLVALIALMVLSQMKEYTVFQQDFKTTATQSSARFHLNNSNVKHEIKLKVEVPFGKKVHEEISVKETHSSYNTLKKDINMSYKTSIVTIPFEPSVRGEQYHLTLKDQNSTADTTLKLTIVQPLLSRYFTILLIISMVGVFLSSLLKDEKEAWLTLWLTTIYIYIIAIFPFSFFVLGFGMIWYLASRFGLKGFFASLFSYIIILNILN